MATKKKTAAAAAGKVKPAVLVTIKGGKVSADGFASPVEAKAKYDDIVAKTLAGKGPNVDEIQIIDKHGLGKSFKPNRTANKLKGNTPASNNDTKHVDILDD
jgi:hypothetical protein